MRVPVLFPGLVIALALAAAPALPAQATVSGRVLDSQTEQPIDGAAVTLPDEGIRAVTDAEGRFELRGVPEGEHRWVIRRVGYSQWEESAAVADGDRFTIRLLARPVRLEAVQATVSRLERRRRAYSGSVRAVESREIELSAAASLLDLVMYRALSGATICGSGSVCTSARAGRHMPVTVVVDDRPPLGVEGTAGMLRSYHPSEIHSVEAYDGGEVVRVYTKWYVETLRGPLPPLRRF